MFQSFIFGTDGIRGTANTWPILPGTILDVAMATVGYFKQQKKTHSHDRFTVVIGKDTRLSGYMVESCLVAGFVAMGANVILLGPLPTPGVAMLTRSLRADLGVMISASHNPYYDNGIKFFTAEGHKLSEKDEKTITTLVENRSYELAEATKLGKAKRLDDAVGRYIEFAKATFPKGQRLDGLKVVVDCAHGAAYKVAPRIFWELGADVITLNASPNGENINDHCGATDVRMLQEAVVTHQADIGIALDGDADRLIVVNAAGNVVDGDQLIALIATAWKQSGQISTQTVVATVMSNLGLERYLESINLSLHRAPVGDRAVLEAMRQFGSNIGGEQSGHIVLSDFTTTGDGIIAALQILSYFEKNKHISHVFDPVPQVTTNVKITKKLDLMAPHIINAIAQAQQKLGDEARLLVRPSGTEPLIRIMAQGDDHLLLDQVVKDLAQAISLSA